MVHWIRASALASLVGACGPTGLTAGAVSPPSIELWGAETFDFQEGKLRAHGFADRVVYRRDTGDGEAAQVRLTLFSSRPSPTGSARPGAGRAARSVLLTAPIASGNPAGQEVRAEGGVVLSSEAGDQGRTDRAAYQGQASRASGNDPLHLWGPGYDLHAPGFTLDTLRDRLDLGRAELVAKGGAP